MLGSILTQKSDLDLRCPGRVGPQVLRAGLEPKSIASRFNEVGFPAGAKHQPKNTSDESCCSTFPATAGWQNCYDELEAIEPLALFDYSA